jgi:hypothetical protein
VVVFINGYGADRSVRFDVKVVLPATNH